VLGPRSCQLPAQLLSGGVLIGGTLLSHRLGGLRGPRGPLGLGELSLRLLWVPDTRPRH